MGSWEKNQDQYSILTNKENKVQMGYVPSVSDIRYESTGPLNLFLVFYPVLYHLSTIFHRSPCVDTEMDEK